MKMTEDVRKLIEAKHAFEKRGHKATLIQNSDRYTIIDWRRSDGSGEYYVNYIIDRKRGSLVISGDLGDCIATWYNPNSVHNITEYIRSVYYFIGKFQCSSDKFEYDEDKILDDIKEEDAALIGRMFLKIQDIAKDLGLENGYRAVINCGEDGQQTVKHLHIHILGKRKMTWPPG